MGRKLQDWVKNGRRQVKRWDKVLGRYALNHPCSESEPVSRYAHHHQGTEIHYKNLPRGDFFLKFSSNGDVGAIEYSRKIAPYFENTQNNLNVEVCSDLVGVVADCARSVGLVGALDYDGRVSGVKPAVTFGGKFESESFDVVAKLLGMTEALIDFKLKRVDQTMERPYHYAVLKKLDDERGLRYIERAENVSVLGEAVGVLVLARELKSGLGIDNAMYLNDDWLRRTAKENHGRFMNPDDFVKSK